jgi:hypothetical protein
MLEQKEFNNEDRRRYYGVRVGDRVSFDYTDDGPKVYGTVVGYEPMDNNAVFVQWDRDDGPSKICPEWLKVIIKVEDMPC